MSRPLLRPEQLYACEVHDSSDNKVGGKVEMVWVDEASSQPEFVGVNTNWLLKGKVHPIPLAEATVEEDVIRVPYSEDQIKGALDIGTDVELTPGLEAELYSHYGVERPPEVGPTSRPEGSGLGEDSIVMPGTFNAFTGDAETLAESRAESGGEDEIVDQEGTVAIAPPVAGETPARSPGIRGETVEDPLTAQEEAPRLRRVSRGSDVSDTPAE